MLESGKMKGGENDEKGDETHPEKGRNSGNQASHRQKERLCPHWQY